jgi:hypothetical protein
LGREDAEKIAQRIAVKNPTPNGVVSREHFNTLLEDAKALAAFVLEGESDAD